MQELLEVRSLSTTFHTKQQDVLACENVSFSVNRGEIVGVVGESGSGKTASSQSIVRLQEEGTCSYSGEVLFEGQNLLQLSEQEISKVRGRKISMIFQDPMSCLNPILRIGTQLQEIVKRDTSLTKTQVKQTMIDLLEQVHVSQPELRLTQYPHELSGGLLQRIVIAMAFAAGPDLLIADEPTTALDVTTQGRVLQLISDMRDFQNAGVIFITHDLGVVAELCDRVVVMWRGSVVEDATVEDLFAAPKHPYTRGLLAARPTMTSDISKRLPTLDEFLVPQNRSVSSTGGQQ